MSEVNGSRIFDAQPEVRPDTRNYCDTCKWSNLFLAAGGAVMLCRRNPPQPLGSFLAVNQAGQVVVQLFSQTMWPVVNKDDFCGQHEMDPAAAARKTPAQRLIASDSSQAS